MSRKLSLAGALICVLLLCGSLWAQAPVVVATSPVNGAEDVAYDVIIHVDFDIQVDAETIDESSMIVTGSLTGVHEGTYVYSPILRRVYFEATDEFGLGEQVTVELTTAITSQGGTPLADDYTWDFTIADPAVVNVVPRDGATDIPVTDSLVITFNGNIDATTLSNSTIQVNGSLTGGHQGEILYLPNDLLAIFYPDTPFGLSEEVTVTLTTGIASTQGVALPADYSWSFTTAAPQAMTSSPTNGVQSISVDTFLTITFNGSMDPSSFTNETVILSGSKTGPHTATFAYDDDMWQLTITPDIPFGLMETISVVISTAVASAEGVALAEEYSWAFLTQGPLVIDVSPDSGAMNVANGALISATFNGSMDAESFNDTTVLVSGVLSGEHVGVISYDPFTRTLNFDPNTDFVVGELITVTLTKNVASTEGTKLDPAYSWSFSTASPQVVSVTPVDNSLNVPVSSNVAVTFDMDMDASSLNDTTLMVLQGSTGILPGTIEYDAGSRTATFAPAADFRIGEVLTVIVAIGVTSEGGVHLAHGHTWSFTTAVAGGNGSFSGQVNYETGSQPRSVFGADFDMDGAIDLVSANSESNNVEIFWNGGSGLFNTSINYTTGRFPCQVVTGDINRDGGLDIITANYLANTISFIAKDISSARGFKTAVKEDVGSGPRGVVLADLNGDGYLDLVTANMYSNDVTVYIHTGLVGQAASCYDSSFTYHVGTSPRKVIAVDLDGDQDIDLATANAFSNDVTVLFNHGDGMFDTDDGVLYLAVGDHPYSLTSADLDSDGDLDLITTDAWTDQVTVLVNGGDGDFVSSSSYAVDQFPRAVCAADADFDGNGLIDLATVNADDNSLSLLLNNGGGSFAAATSYAIGRFPFGLCTADVDGDGDLDIVTANNADNNLTVLFNGGTATSVEGGAITLPVAYSLAQNYPNPFNPTTTIAYSIGRPAEVSLEIYNALGQQVLNLDLGHQQVGAHEVHWDGRDRSGRDLPSGVYFYRLSSGDFTETKKMVLMK